MRIAFGKISLQLVKIQDKTTRASKVKRQRERERERERENCNWDSRIMLENKDRENDTRKGEARKQTSSYNEKESKGDFAMSFNIAQR